MVLMNIINIWTSKWNETYGALLCGVSYYLLEAYTEQAEVREDSFSLTGYKLGREALALELGIYTVRFPGFQAFALVIELI